MDEFWQQATQILASGAPAVLATVMAVHRQVPKVSPPGACLIVMPTGTVGGLDGGAVDSLVVLSLQSALLAPAAVHDVTLPAEGAHRYGMLHGGTVELLVQHLTTQPPYAAANESRSMIARRMNNGNQCS